MQWQAELDDHLMDTRQLIFIGRFRTWRKPGGAGQRGVVTAPALGRKTWRSRARKNERRALVSISQFRFRKQEGRQAAAHWIHPPPTDYLEQGPRRPHQDSLLVRSRTLLVREEKERPLVR
jgi:hypothetical protein